MFDIIVIYYRKFSVPNISLHLLFYFSNYRPLFYYFEIPYIASSLFLLLIIKELVSAKASIT